MTSCSDLAVQLATGKDGKLDLKDARRLWAVVEDGGVTASEKAAIVLVTENYKLTAGANKFFNTKLEEVAVVTTEEVAVVATEAAEEVAAVATEEATEEATSESAPMEETTEEATEEATEEPVTEVEGSEANTEATADDTDAAMDTTTTEKTEDTAAAAEGATEETATEDADKKSLPTGAKYDRVCPSVRKGETCWALSKGKQCHYAIHDSDGLPPPKSGNGPDANANTNVYVCHLPASTSKAQLEEMFTVYGGLSETKLLVDSRTGAFKGVAFVHFNNHAEAKDAIEAINGLQMGEKTLECRFAKPNSKSGAFTGGARGSSVRDAPRPYHGGGGGYGRRPEPYSRYGGPPQSYGRPSYDDYGPPRGPPRGGDYGGYGPDRGRHSFRGGGGGYDRGPPPGRDYGGYDRGPGGGDGGYDREREMGAGYERGPSSGGSGYSGYETAAHPRRRYDPYLEHDDGGAAPGPAPSAAPAAAPASAAFPAKYDPYGAPAGGGPTYMPAIGMPRK